MLSDAIAIHAIQVPDGETRRNTRKTGSNIACNRLDAGSTPPATLFSASPGLNSRAKRTWPSTQIDPEATLGVPVASGCYGEIAKPRQFCDKSPPPALHNGAQSSDWFSSLFGSFLQGTCHMGDGHLSEAFLSSKSSSPSKEA